MPIHTVPTGTRRNRRRQHLALKEQRDRAFLRAWRDAPSIWGWSLPGVQVPLDEPEHVGYVRTLVLKRWTETRRDRPVLERLLPLIAPEQFSRNRQFRYRDRWGRRRRTYHAPALRPYLLTPYQYERLTPEERRYFAWHEEPVSERDPLSHHTEWVFERGRLLWRTRFRDGYRFLYPDLLEPRVDKLWRTHRLELDREAMREAGYLHDHYWNHHYGPIQARLEGYAYGYDSDWEPETWRDRELRRIHRAEVLDAADAAGLRPLRISI